MSTNDHVHARRKQLLLRIGLILIGILLIFIELRIHAPKILALLEHGDVQEVEQYVRSSGSRGIFVLVSLQIIETVAIVIPSLPVYLCAGIIFGVVQGSLICYITNWILCVLMFVISKRMNQVTAGISDNSNESIVQDLLQKTTHPIRAIFFLCLLPIVPGGMIPILSAHTKLTLREFIKGMTFGSFAIVIYVACGDLLMRNNYKATIWILVVVVIIFLLIMIFRKFIIAKLK